MTDIPQLATLAIALLAGFILGVAAWHVTYRVEHSRQAFRAFQLDDLESHPHCPHCGRALFYQAGEEPPARQQ